MVSSLYANFPYKRKSMSKYRVAKKRQNTIKITWTATVHSSLRFLQDNFAINYFSNGAASQFAAGASPKAHAADPGAADLRIDVGGLYVSI